MRYGIISDIHGNFEALLSVLETLDRLEVDKIINCGDIIGYGPEPDRCTDIVRERSDISSVKGNHEAGLADKPSDFLFNSSAGSALEWTRKQLGRRNIKYIESLDTCSEDRNFIFLHGTPRNPVYEYMLLPAQALDNFGLFRRQICFLGHTHLPACFKLEGEDVREVSARPGSSVRLEKTCRYIINPGSVGQPRDRDPRAAFCIYDDEETALVFERAEYDIESTQKKINEAGLPRHLASRLSEGV